MAFFFSIFFVIQHYFSEKNIISTNKIRSSYSINSDNNSNVLPILKNDTYDIIFYIDDLENFKNQKKKRFWENLISNKNE